MSSSLHLKDVNRRSELGNNTEVDHDKIKIDLRPNWLQKRTPVNLAKTETNRQLIKMTQNGGYDSSRLSMNGNQAKDSPFE